MSYPLGEFYEFFAGAGMARAGLGRRWQCLFANDFDHKKAAAYRLNWGNADFLCDDVGNVSPGDLPGHADLVWASFPCQDLSLAGGRAGLKGQCSGAFWPFWNLMRMLIKDGRAPALVVLENVCGTLTSHEGKDFAMLGATLGQEGYRFGGLVIDAAQFVPQSRPRLFIIAARQDIDLPRTLTSDGPCGEYHPRTLKMAHRKLPASIKSNWIWWKTDSPPARNIGFSNLVEENPTSVVWHTLAETRKLLSMMSRANAEKVQKAMREGRRMVGTVYKRTRRDENGRKVQRAEVRFDDIAGCLRTPAGGSSRQLVIIVEGDKVRSRLISSRETARLMGLPDDYILPDNYNAAYHLTGDGVVVPVVRFLSQTIFEPVLAQTFKLRAAA